MARQANSKRPTRTEFSYTIVELADSFERSLWAKIRSPLTVQSYLESLRQLAKFLKNRRMPTALEAIRRQHSHR